MIDGMELFMQLLRIALGFTLAVIAAALFLTWGLYKTISFHAGPEASVVQALTLAWTMILSTSVIGMLSLIPGGFAIGFAELMKWRGIVYHVAAGGVIALVLWGATGALPPDLFYVSSDATSHVFFTSSGPTLAPINGLRPGSSVAASAGFIAGFTYWLTAGRKSGCWRVEVSSSREI